eukprot:m.477893 g.477893  ORF g.477893 m.477893 type:complete len:491 (-) comp20982_c0_seq1:1170-2642(-)
MAVVHQYSPSWIVRGLHALPHVNEHFRVVSSDVSLHAYSEEYAESIAIIGAFVLLVVLLLLLAVAISFCCTCCCLKHGYLTEQCDRSFVRVRWAVGILGLLGVAGCCVAAYATVATNNHISQTYSRGVGLQTTYENLHTEVEELAQGANSVEAAVLAVKPSLPTSTDATVADLEETLQKIMSTARNVAGDMPSVDASYKSFVDFVEKWWRVGNLAIAAALGLVCLVAVVMACKPSKSAFALVAMFGWFFLLLAGVVVTAEFMASVGVSDACVNITGFIGADMDEVHVAYYIECDGRPNPFESDFSQGLAAFVKAGNDARLILSQANNSVEMHRIAANITSLGSDFATVTEQLDCVGPHNQYIGIVDALCTNTIGDIFLLYCSLGAAFLTTIAVLFAVAAGWRHVASKTRYSVLPASGYQRDETVPLLSTSVNSAQMSAAPECCVCFDEPVGTTFLPCGHAIGKECGRRPDLVNCPVCRKRIEARTDLFLT